MKTVRWNVDRQNKLNEADAAAKKEAGKAIVMAMLNREWRAWKKRLTNKKGGASNQDIIASLYELQNIVGKRCTDEGLEEWKGMTLTLIDDKICRIIAAGITDVNEVRQKLPESMKDQEPHVARVTTKEEFEALPWIAPFFQKPSFLGFLRDFPRLVALYHDGEAVVVATGSSEVAWMQYPDLQQYRASLAATGEPGQSPESPSKPTKTSGPS